MTHSIRAYRTTQDERKNTINLRFIAFIAINLIFAMPCLNAGLADWISDNLPKTWQVSQEYRDEVKHIQGKTGKPVPIIFVNSNRDSLGSALNFGVGPLRFAMMLINQKKFSANTSDDNTQTLAHETKHIDENHGGVQHAAYL